MRGRGSARATIESSLTAQSGGTRVDIVTDLTMNGAVAQYGRGGRRRRVRAADRPLADCLRAQLDAAEPPQHAEAAVAEAGRPVCGLRLGLAALWRAFTRLFRRRS